MIKRSTLFLAVLILMLLSSSCTEYQKVLKQKETKGKYELAEKLYNEGKYKKALRLFQQIEPQFRGKPQGERVIFFYADSYYKTKDYFTSSFRFESFVKSYPNSVRAEDAAFYEAKSYYFLSPTFSLDQTETYTAIEKLQNFINTHPNSEYIAESNVMVRELTEKLHKKSFEIGRQFNKINDHYAAIKSLDLFLSDNPGSVYKEDAMYYMLDSSFKLAVNSIQSKKEQRLNDAKEVYEDLMKSFKESKYLKEVTYMAGVLNKELKQFSK